MILKLTIASLVVLSTFAKNEFLRNLQSSRNAPRFYGDNVTIGFREQLGCGACIRGNYIYCIPGDAGSDPTTWPANLNAICCRDAATCPQASDSKYLCSNSYSDSTLAKGMCPFNPNNCGNASAFAFSSVGE